MLKPQDLQPDREILPPDIPWYKKKSCLFLLFIFIVLIAGCGVFGWYVLKYYQSIKKGEVPAEIIAMFPEQYNQENISEVTIDDDPWQGNKNAELVVIAFEDFQCPICGEQYPVLKKILPDYQDKILFVYRDFPTNHEFSQKAAEAAQCAYEQDMFWQYHDFLFSNQSLMTDETVFSQFAAQLDMNTTAFDQCLNTSRYKTEVQKDFFDGKLAGVSGTPTFYLNGYKLEGAYSEQFWREALDYLLSKQ